MSYRRPKPDKARQKAMNQFWGVIDECKRPVTTRRIVYRSQQPTAVKPPAGPRKITKAREEGSLEKDEDV